MGNPTATVILANGKTATLDARLADQLVKMGKASYPESSQEQAETKPRRYRRRDMQAES
jgi:hypothetical protein